MKKQEAEEPFSLRFVSGLEIGSVISSVLLTTWALMPLQQRHRWLAAVPAILAVGLMLYSHRVRGERLGEIGFTTRGFWRAVRLVLPPTLAACGVFAAIGYWAGSFHQTSNFRVNLLVVPVWALIQQYVLQGFIYRRCREMLPNAGRAWPAILAAAGLFALVHAPNRALMILTFCGAMIWSRVYERAPNLFALALSHAAISMMLMTSLPPWLLESMSVGYKHFLYQKF
ncbi:MAG: lysostaphin resistance A-like protein [Blastocatellia bacterium]